MEKDIEPCTSNPAGILSIAKLLAASYFVMKAIAVAFWHGVILGSDRVETTRNAKGVLTQARYLGACGVLVIRWTAKGPVRSFSLSRRLKSQASAPPGATASKSTETTAPLTSQHLVAASSHHDASGALSRASEYEASSSSEALAALR